MEEVDNFALLSYMVEAYTRDYASLNATEPTMYPMSINEMSQVAPKTYNFCQVCGVQGHYGYECSYNIFNSQNTQLRPTNDYQEGYKYNQYSNSCDQLWMDQPTFSYTDNGFQNFSYHDQPQFQQQYYEEQYEPLQQYQYSLPEEPQFSLTDVAMEAEKTNEMLKEVMHEINELKTQNLMMEVQIAQLASSSTTWQTESPSPSVSIQPEMGINTVILASDEEYDNFSICVDDVPTDKEEDRAIYDEIDDVVVVDHVLDDGVSEESNAKLVLVSIPTYVPEILMPTRMDDMTKEDQWFDNDKFAFTLTSTLVHENTCFKVDVMSRIIQDDLSQNLLGDPFQKALIFQFSEEGDSSIDTLSINVRSQEIQLTPEEVRSSEKPPPKPPPYVNVKRVQSFYGCEFYRCFITKFSKSTKYFDHLLLLDVTIKFTNACLETFCRIKTTIDVLNFVLGGKVLFEKVDTPRLFLRGLKRSSQ